VVDSTYITLEAIDTLGQMITRDSLVIKTTYHNDRTIKQANVIIDQLELLGVDRRSLTLFVNARPEEVADNRRTEIRLAVRPKK
jgi:hypothetical protein